MTSCTLKYFKLASFRLVYSVLLLAVSQTSYSTTTSFFGGKSLDEWQVNKGEEILWQVKAGAISFYPLIEKMK